MTSDPPQFATQLEGKLCYTLWWAVEQYARECGLSLAQACQLLAVKAPTNFMVQILNTGEEAFRERGL